MDVMSVIEHCSHNKVDALLISFDFEKAFDKVEWHVLDKTLDFFGYEEVIRAMVKTLHTDIQSCVMNNNIPSDWFNLTREKLKYIGHNHI